jgi:hypothetical protein
VRIQRKCRKEDAEEQRREERYESAADNLEKKSYLHVCSFLLMYLRMKLENLAALEHQRIQQM